MTKENIRLTRVVIDCPADRVSNGCTSLHTTHRLLQSIVTYSVLYFTTSNVTPEWSFNKTPLCNARPDACAATDDKDLCTQSIPAFCNPDLTSRQDRYALVSRYWDAGAECQSTAIQDRGHPNIWMRVCLQCGDPRHTWNRASQGAPSSRRTR